MPRVNDIVQRGVKDMTDSLKAIKSSEEDDLGELGTMFSDLAGQADKVAQKLFQADDALGGTHQGVEEANEDEEE